MKNAKVNIPILLSSLAGGLIAAVLMTPNDLNALTHPVWGAVWTGALFLLVYIGGFAGLNVAVLFKRKIKLRRSKAWIAAAVICGVLLFVTGAAGQALFLRNIEETVVIDRDVDIVMLLDSSGSMDSDGYSTPRSEAACEFIDSMDDTCMLQAVSFASVVIDKSDFVRMDDDGKAAVKQFILDIDSIGMTDFTAPLETAANTLNSEGRSGAAKCAVILTDGEGELDSSVADLYLTGDIRLYSIRINSSSSLSGNEKKLVDLVNATGGFDIRLKPKSDGSIETSDMLAAFYEVFEGITETEIIGKRGLLVCSGFVDLSQFIVRLITFALCGALFGLGYYGKLKLTGLLMNICVGAALAVVITVLGFIPYIGIYLFAIAMSPAIVSLSKKESEVIDV